MSITKYSVRYPFIINKDEDGIYYCEPFWPFDIDSFGTYGDDMMDALKTAGDLAIILLGELTEEQKEQWRGCYDPERPNIYLIQPRYYCSFCECYDECSPECASPEYEFLPEDDDDE